MIYRVHIVVLLAVPDSALEPAGVVIDKVEYTLGINALDHANAVNIAVASASNAVDRDGRFIGGVVIETHCRCANREEYNGYEKYFHSPIGEHGVFYVSGTTWSTIAKELTIEAHIELKKIRENIKRFGFPSPSFVHPKLPQEPPAKIRLLCTACGHWVEVNSLGLIYMFMGRHLTFTDEERDELKAHDVAGPFMRRHFPHCHRADKPCSNGIAGIHEDDEQWNKLHEANEEELNDF